MAALHRYMETLDAGHPIGARRPKGAPDSTGGQFASLRQAESSVALDEGCWPAPGGAFEADAAARAQARRLHTAIAEADGYLDAELDSITRLTRQLHDAHARVAEARRRLVMSRRSALGQGRRFWVEQVSESEHDVAELSALLAEQVSELSTILGDGALSHTESQRWRHVVMVATGIEDAETLEPLGLRVALVDTRTGQESGRLTVPVTPGDVVDRWVVAQVADQSIAEHASHRGDHERARPEAAA